MIDNENKSNFFVYSIFTHWHNEIIDVNNEFFESKNNIFNDFENILNVHIERVNKRQKIAIKNASILTSHIDFIDESNESILTIFEFMFDSNIAKKAITLMKFSMQFEFQFFFFKSTTQKIWKKNNCYWRNHIENETK